MYGTVARVRVKDGKEGELLEYEQRWTEACGVETGQIAGYVFKLDARPGEYLFASVFSDREAYRRNADDPETDCWYRGLLELLAGEPEWHDGEVVQSALLAGI